MKIILLDDHKIFGASLQLLLEEQEEIALCHYSSTINDFLNQLKVVNYDILLIDINLNNEITGLALIERLLSKDQHYNIIILTSYDLDHYKDTAFKLGAKDFINKSVEIEELVNRIQRVYTGNANARSKHYVNDPLTKRELEVLQELIKGDHKKEIAKRLFISERTLYNHIAHIYDKLEAKNLVEAYNKAMEIGYIDPVM